MGGSGTAANSTISGGSNDGWRLSASIGLFDISGNVFNDGNGLSDGLVNGTAPNLAGMFINILDANGIIVASAPVAADGSYTVADVFTSSGFTAILTNSATSTTATPPTGYAFTGENSMDASNVTDGTVNGTSTPFSVTLSDLTNQNFAIERPPVSENVILSVVGAPVIGVPVTLSNPLQGSDPETSTTPGTSWATQSVSIESLPTNGFDLYYDGVLITQAMIGTTGYKIDNYDPSKLTIQATAATPNGTNTTSFNFSIYDPAGVKDPTPSTYTVTFSSGLPVVFGTISATIKGNLLLVNWSTVKEVNVAYYDVEASANGTDFVEIGSLNTKAENGNSALQLNYTFSSSVPLQAATGIIALAGLLLGFSTRRKKLIASVLFIIASGIFIASCTKNSDEKLEDKNVFIRIVQVDIDGNKQYSKVTKAIKE